VTETRGALVGRYLVGAYFIEVGIILLLVPWSGFWDRNIFRDAVPVVEPLMRSPVVRGAVSGLGIVNLLAGFADLVSLVFARRR
jgi:hypothetical protein